MNTLAEALDYFRETLARHPERDALAAEEAALTGARRPYAVLSLNHQNVPDDRDDAPAFFQPPPFVFADSFEGRLARELVGRLRALDLLNPIAAVVGAGGPRSPADLIPSFGTPLSEDGGAAAFARPLADLLAAPPPDPDTAGLMPVYREHIARVKSATPDWVRIGMPDMQGPFNLAHALIGDEAFVAPLTEPAEFAAFMERIVDFWIAATERLLRWIGPERLTPMDRLVRIAECSVNLVSEAFYQEHILPHDLRIARHFGLLRIHPCSGRHVFHATLDGLPGVCASEAGLMRSKMAAVCVSVDAALKMIGDRAVAISIGQELPADFDEAFAFIARDLDRYAACPRLLFGYTGMDWRRRDRPAIRCLHQRLDAYWIEHVVTGSPCECAGGEPR